MSNENDCRVRRAQDAWHPANLMSIHSLKPYAPLPRLLSSPQFYRRNTKVAGAASFSTLYTAISTLSVSFPHYRADGHPAKRPAHVTLARL